MTTTTPDPALTSPSVPDATGLRDPGIHRLQVTLSSLLDELPEIVLPDWDYKTWCRALSYPDLGSQAQVPTRTLGRARDEALAQPATRALVEWAGSRRSTEPAAGAAAALVAVRAVQHQARSGRVDVGELSLLIRAAVDAARPLRVSSPRCLVLVAEPDRLAEVERDSAPAENPLLSDAVGSLLGMACAGLEAGIVTRIEGAVIQAGDWWARHALAVPTALEGPALPGVLPAQRLRGDDRLPEALAEPTLLGLVAGPQPGRKRPCQVAWRRGLTFWVAAELSSSGEPQRPPCETIRWWRTELAHLELGPSKSSTAGGSGDRVVAS